MFIFNCRLNDKGHESQCQYEDAQAWAKVCHLVKMLLKKRKREREMQAPQEKCLRPAAQTLIKLNRPARQIPARF